MIIQRPQNLYFLLCAGLCAAAVSRFMGQEMLWSVDVLLMMAAGVVAFVAIFLFKLPVDTLEISFPSIKILPLFKL